MLKIAHRGASGYETENTLAAFKKAVELGVDMVELDVRTCKTGEAIVLHDKFINSKKIAIKKLSLPELQQIHLETGETIPTLKKALSIIPQHVKINIDIKDTKATNEVVRLVESEVGKGRTYKDILITTYNFWTIVKINKMNPRILTSLLIFFFPTFLIKLASRLNNTVSVQLQMKHVSEQTVHLAHQFGLQVFAWVANDPEEITRLKKIRVDGIITDFPDRI